jgi:hypothetical protein
MFSLFLGFSTIVDGQLLTSLFSDAPVSNQVSVL